MKKLFSTRLPWLLWLLALALWITDWLYPLSDKLTRSIGLVLLPVVWLGLIGLCWKHRGFRLALIILSALCAIFLLLPGRKQCDSLALRNAYVTGLRRYAGVHYYWGGEESPKGVDCSGLIRRGLIDALFFEGIRTLDPGLVRRSIWIWGHDCSAQALGEGHGFAKRLFSATNLNTLDHSRIMPGDLTVTNTGIHILAYLGENVWIEADPAAGHVITGRSPSDTNIWFLCPMNIVRWNVFQ